MGMIQLEEMEFYAFHGHFKEEQIVGNRFLVNLTIHSSLKKPAESDNLKDAINYQTAYEVVKNEMTRKSHLLEHIAGRILDSIHNHFEGIEKVSVKVSKMNPPVGGKIKCVSVTMEK
jgi:dihydroneopterin aldolase